MATNFNVSFKPRFGDIDLGWKGELGNPSGLFNFIDANLEKWKKQKSPSIWVKLQGNDLEHVKKFIDHGFELHRIENSNAIFMNKWIRPGKKTLPIGPFGYFGVGGMCINKEGKLLCIRENYKSGPGQWKLPGGLFDIEKDKKFSDTAIREVYEETGIRAKFDHVINARFNAKSVMFGAPDLYTIVRLSPLTTEITKDPSEIAEAAWIDPQELVKQGYPMNKFAIDTEKEGDIGYTEFDSDVHSPHTIYMRNRV